MIQFIIFLLIGVAGVLVGYYLAVRRKTKNKNPHITRQQVRKEEGKQKILKLFQKKEEIRNDDVEKMLGVSDATATNYLEELEVEAKIYQIGRRGRYVVYRRKY